ncbi:hypothetical protein [Nocardioides scoriae]|uniref:hypothetical protein n=1 Tax=Nocardioides scoriae TaxID=642780 RepID=UPI000B89780E|nr:hypothetical protein [Nocardioides scoriae]
MGFAAVMVVGLGTVVAARGTYSGLPIIGGRPTSDQTPGATSPEQVARLVRDHGCWTRSAPPDMAGRIPGHVVLTVRGDDGPVTTYAGARWVGPALAHVFEGGHPEVLHVHAFCR